MQKSRLKRLGSGLRKSASSKWQTIKVKKETYQELKKLGEGIGSAVDIMVKEHAEAVEGKMAEIEKLGKELGQEMLKAGLFNIRLKSIKIDSAIEEGSEIIIKGGIKVEVSNANARARMLEILNREKEVSP